MRYETCEKSSTESLWRQYRDQFPVTGQLIYLNHAAVSPLCRPAAEAMRKLAEDALFFGSYHYDQWIAVYQGVRESAAKLIGSEPGEIAIVKNTSEGIATVATGLDWRPRDKIVAFREEFAANYFPWKVLESNGLRVEWLSCRDPLDKIDAACQGARLLAISFVEYLDGHRVDLESVGEICHRRGCIFLVDAIQGLGAFPLDVKRARIHVLASGGQKWLLGPEGCGILYIQRELQDSVRPIEFGWTNVARYADYASRDMTLRPDAGRYECGTLNTIGCCGLRAAIDFLLEVGVERIASAVQALTGRIASGVSEKGYQILGSRSLQNSSGIVSFRKEGVDSHSLVRNLRASGIIASPRLGWLRVSPHFYISPEEADRLIEALP